LLLAGFKTIFCKFKIVKRGCFSIKNLNMKNLILIRHAKSSWEAPLKDFDRPLMKNGIQDAHLVSSNIYHFLPKTFLIWSSPSARASETALIFAQNISFPIESIIYKKELYTFDEKQLEKVIKSCDNGFESIILFGHNEAITNFVNKFGDVFVDNVPTSGFVSIQFDADSWEKINKGKTQKMIFPKDLK
jgi:phosphohistidine phosphatase